MGLLLLCECGKANADCGGGGTPEDSSATAAMAENENFTKVFSQNLLDNLGDTAADHYSLKDAFNVEEGQSALPIGPTLDWVHFNTILAGGLANPGGMTSEQSDAIGKAALDYSLGSTAAAFATAVAGGLATVVTLPESVVVGVGVAIGVATGVGAKYASEAMWLEQGRDRKISVKPPP